ncbi:MAG: glycosyltransferase [Candidatus Lokiarchaeota archaeon]|nr:glycosyltransferase [Candidatus Lokiarchaeota archaeon]
MVISFHILSFLFRDKKYINHYNQFHDPEIIKIDDLKYLPLINLIIPAWKEGEKFEICLNSVKKLSYPNLKIIINAGGNEQTIKIAEKFKKFDNFIILHQRFGASRPSLGKIRALNECLDHISEGLVYFIDADAIFEEETLLRVIYPIINLNKKVVVSGRRLIPSLKKKDLSKYLVINRNDVYHGDYSREDYKIVSGSNTCLDFEVIQKLGKFTENEKIATDKSMANDINNKGYNIFHLTHYNSRMMDQSLPSDLKSWKRQRSIWLSNNFIYYLKFNKIKNIIKFFLLIIISIYIMIFPIFLFLNYILFTLGVYFFEWIYVQKIRKVIFYLKTTEKKYQFNLNYKFYLKLLGLIIIEMMINITLIYEIIKYKKLVN